MFLSVYLLIHSFYLSTYLFIYLLASAVDLAVSFSTHFQAAAPPVVLVVTPSPDAAAKARGSGCGRRRCNDRSCPPDRNYLTPPPRRLFINKLFYSQRT